MLLGLETTNMATCQRWHRAKHIVRNAIVSFSAIAPFVGSPLDLLIPSAHFGIP
jgi:hypothetical protein